MSDILSDLKKCVSGATKKWAKQRKAEERSARARYSREYLYSDRVNFTDVVGIVLPPAYDHASGGGKYVVSKRQMYYAAREEFRKRTGREITSKRCDSLLLQFMNRDKRAAGWQVTADPRGTLTIPNTFAETRIPCGTIAIDRHLSKMDDPCSTLDVPEVPRQWPSLAPGQRYQAVLYIEKEGFEPVMQQARIAERYGLAVVSCKGHSVVAARKFVDHACRVNGGVPVLTVHDLDVSGFSIAARLTTVSDAAIFADRVAYQFRNDVNSIDLGLRLVDAKRYGLATERCKKRPRRIPRDLGCTDEESALLLSGKRIELNAFTAPQFVEWIESKIQAAGIREHWVPDDAGTLEAAFRRAAAVAVVNESIEAVHAAATEKAAAVPLPANLRRIVSRHVKKHGVPWDIALSAVAAEAMGIAPDADAKESEPPSPDAAATAAEIAERYGVDLSPEFMAAAERLAKYTEAELDQAMDELRAEGDEITSADIERRLKRNRRRKK
jgi:hypothetical protein